MANCSVCGRLQRLVSTGRTMCQTCGNRIRKYGDGAATVALRHGQPCEICLKRPGTCLDHEHESSTPRGMLCMHCNHILGQAFDDPDILERAMKYLLARSSKSGRVRSKGT